MARVQVPGSTQTVSSAVLAQNAVLSRSFSTEIPSLAARAYVRTRTYVCAREARASVSSFAVTIVITGRRIQRKTRRPLAGSDVDFF